MINLSSAEPALKRIEATQVNWYIETLLDVCGVACLESPDAVSVLGSFYLLVPALLSLRCKHLQFFHTRDLINIQ